MIILSSIIGAAKAVGAFVTANAVPSIVVGSVVAVGAVATPTVIIPSIQAGQFTTIFAREEEKKPEEDVEDTEETVDLGEVTEEPVVEETPTEPKQPPVAHNNAPYLLEKDWYGKTLYFSDWPISGLMRCQKDTIGLQERIVREVPWEEIADMHYEVLPWKYRSDEHGSYYEREMAEVVTGTEIQSLEYFQKAGVNMARYFNCEASFGAGWYLLDYIESPNFYLEMGVASGYYAEWFRTTWL